jgi:hypothetical protein
MSGPTITAHAQAMPKGQRIIVRLGDAVIRQWTDSALTDRAATASSYAAMQGASGMFIATQGIRHAAAALMWTLDNINPAFPLAPGKIAQIEEQKAALRSELSRFTGDA